MNKMSSYCPLDIGFCFDVDDGQGQCLPSHINTKYKCLRCLRWSPMVCVCVVCCGMCCVCIAQPQMIYNLFCENRVVNQTKWMSWLSFEFLYKLTKFSQLVRMMLGHSYEPIWIEACLDSIRANWVIIVK